MHAANTMKIRSRNEGGEVPRIFVGLVDGAPEPVSRGFGRCVGARAERSGQSGGGHHRFGLKRFWDCSVASPREFDSPSDRHDFLVGHSIVSKHRDKSFRADS